MAISDEIQALANAFGTGDILRPNLYWVEILTPEWKSNWSLLVEATSIPESKLTTVASSAFGYPFTLPGDFQPETEWEVSVYCNAELDVKKMLDDWLDKFMDRETNTRSQDLSTLTANAKIYLHDRSAKHNEQNEDIGSLEDAIKENITQFYELEKIWPKSVGSIELGYGTTNAVQKIKVVFGIRGVKKLAKS